MDGRAGTSPLVSRPALHTGLQPLPKRAGLALLSPVPTAVGGLASGEGSPGKGTMGQFGVPILETSLTGWMVGTTEASVARELASL